MIPVFVVFFVGVCGGGDGEKKKELISGHIPQPSRSL